MTVAYDNTTGTLTVMLTADEQRTMRRYRARLRESLRRDTMNKEAALRHWIEEAWDKLAHWTEKQTALAREAAVAQATPDQLDAAIGFDLEA